jgi:hypothetical protein
LAHWLANRVIFGHGDKIIENEIDAWCIAKIIRLVGPVGQLYNPKYKNDFEMAKYFESEIFTYLEIGLAEKFIKVRIIREELEKLSRTSVDSVCIDFIKHLLVIDYSKKLTAKGALRHSWLADID